MLAYLNRAKSLLLQLRPSCHLSYGFLSPSLGFFPSLFLLLSPLFLFRRNLLVLLEGFDHDLSLALPVTIKGHIRSDDINSFGCRSVQIREKSRRRCPPECWMWIRNENPRPQPYLSSRRSAQPRSSRGEGENPGRRWGWRIWRHERTSGIFLNGSLHLSSDRSVLREDGGERFKDPPRKRGPKGGTRGASPSSSSARIRGSRYPCSSPPGP